jgi:ribosomal 50S subunit-recycling heat shock protein
MRIDKFLKVTRLIKRRETAKELCDDNDVLINEKIAKPSSEIVVGDIFTLFLGRHKISAKVMSVRPFAKKNEAEEMYQILKDEINERKMD